MNIFLHGASGSGKGTQAKFIERDFGLVHISMGDLFREVVKSGSEVGKTAHEYMVNGILVPDEITVKIIKERLEKDDIKNGKGFMLDGFPRTLAQAKELAKVVNIDIVILIDVPMEELEKRLYGRRTCDKCGYLWNIYYDENITEKCNKCGGNLFIRSDDKPSAVANRMKFFKENIEDLKEYYKDKLVIAKGQEKREDTYAPIYKALSEFKEN